MSKILSTIPKLPLEFGECHLLSLIVWNLLLILYSVAFLKNVLEGKKSIA